jgi:hypothetical protein
LELGNDEAARKSSDWSLSSRRADYGETNFVGLEGWR